MTTDARRFLCQCGHIWDRHMWKLGGSQGNRRCEEPGCSCRDFVAATDTRRP